MIGKLFSVSVIAALTAALFVILTESPPMTGELDADIKRLQDDISDATKNADAYNGGLIKSLIQARIEILSSTKALLNAKRLSILRRVNLSFQIDGSEFKSDAKIEEIQAEIEAARRRATAAETEAKKYNGGLLQVMELTKAATENISIAQLNSAYYSGKYGLPTIGAFVPKKNREERSIAPIGKTVIDKDAL